MRSYAITHSGTKIPTFYDKWFIFAVVVLLLLGLLMMTSASIVVSDKMMRQPFYFLCKQLIFLFVGVSIGSIMIQLSIKHLSQISGYLLIGSILLLALVLIPGIGHRVNGSARWLGYGPWTFQVSELTKFSVVLYLSGYLVRRQEEIKKQLSGFIKPLIILITIAALLLKEPDFGATVVIITTALGMMFLAGMRAQHFVLLFLCAIAILFTIAIAEPYRILRLTSFINPWERPFDSGYQLTQSLIAFGRGGLTGVGLGNSIQKMFYLPEAHTDFLFAVIAEELGLIGISVVVGLFLLLVMRVLVIGKRAQQYGAHFAGFTAYGFALWLSIQFIVSIGVNSGLLPTKGLTLPLMSYGGSSLIVNCMMIAVLLRIDFENRLRALGMDP